MTVQNDIRINIEGNIFNFNGDNVSQQQLLFQGVLLEMLEGVFDDAALKALIEAGTNKESVQALPPWAQKKQERNALIELLKKEGYLEDDLEDFPVIVDDLEKFPIVEDDLEDFPIVEDDLEKFPIITDGTDGTMHVETKNYSIDAKVVYDQAEQQLCGPAKFHIEIINVEKKTA